MVDSIVRCAFGHQQDIAGLHGPRASHVHDPTSGLEKRDAPDAVIGCELIGFALCLACEEDESGAGDCLPANCGRYPPRGLGYECVAQDGIVWAS